MSDTEFKSGSNIVVGTANLGSGTTLSSTTGTQAITLNVKSLLAGNGCSIASASNTVTVSAVPDPSSQLITAVEDFIGSSTASGSVAYNTNGWVIVDATSGGNANLAVAGHPGIIVVGTGTTSSGVGRANLGVASIFPADGTMNIEIDCRLPTLSSSAQRYIFRAGLGDSASAAPTNGIYWEYSDNLTSGDWRQITMNASTSTATDSTTAVVGNTWYKLGMTVNSAYTSVAFLINGVAAGAANATNLPAAGTALFPFFSIIKTVGTTDTKLNVDYVKFHQVFTTPR